jgi:hypothetical protein
MEVKDTRTIPNKKAREMVLLLLEDGISVLNKTVLTRQQE